MIIEDRNGNMYKIGALKFKDTKMIIKPLMKVMNLLFIYDELAKVNFKLHPDIECTIDEQIDAICEIIKPEYCYRIVNNDDRINYQQVSKNELITEFDIDMLRKAVLYLLDIGKHEEYYKTGNIIKDTNGNEHMVYSYKLNDCKKLMQKLANVDTEAKQKRITLDIMYSALNGKIDRKTIGNNFDVNQAYKIALIYMGIPMDKTED